MKISKNTWKYWIIYFSCWLLVLLPLPFNFTDWQYWSVIVGLCGLYTLALLEEE